MLEQLLTLTSCFSLSKVPVFVLSQRTVWETLCSDYAVIAALLNATATVQSTLTQEQAGMHPSAGSYPLNLL